MKRFTDRGLVYLYAEVSSIIPITDDGTLRALIAEVCESLGGSITTSLTVEEMLDTRQAIETDRLLSLSNDLISSSNAYDHDALILRAEELGLR